MDKVAISVGIGLLAALLLAAAYFGAPYAGVRIEPVQAVVVAAILAFASSTAAFALVALGKPPGGRVYGSTRLNELPVSQFVAIFKTPDTLQIEARPNITLDVLLMRFGDMFKNPAQHSDKKITLIVRKTRKAVFNPRVLKDLFEALKPFKGFEHVLLMNETDGFVGYIPGPRAAKDFSGENAETKIGKFIIDVLDDPEKSKVLRTLDGMGKDDVISETETVRDAARKTWADEPMHGLVVCKGIKPIGVIDKNSLLQLAATGA